MKYAFLIALRDYGESARTKGFWLGILLFPLIILISVQVPLLLGDKVVPQRQFIFVDQSGEFSALIEKGMERFHQRQVLQEIVKYVQKHAIANAMTNSTKVNLEDVPAPSGQLETFLDDFANTNPKAVSAFMEKGGQGFVLNNLKRYIGENAPEFEEPRRRFVRVELPAGIDKNADIAEIAGGLRPFLRGSERLPGKGKGEKLFAAILVPKNIKSLILRPDNPIASLTGVNGIEYWASNLADSQLHDEIRNLINDEVRRQEYEARGVDIGTVRIVEKTRVPLAKLNPKKEKGQEKVSMADYIRQWAPSAFVYLLWISVFSVSQMLLSNMIEEKSNRIIEVLLSSVTPGELMMGKLMGIAGIGLTMIGTWILSLIAVLAWKAGPEFEIALQIFEVLKTSSLLIWFAVYFLVGYTMYAGVILTIGSLCNTQKEAQSFMGLITVVMMVPLFTLMLIPKDPNGSLATILSWIPCFSPFIMMNRVTADPPMFDQVGTLVMMLVFTGMTLWLSGKIFRIAILRTGQPPTFMELYRWLRQKRSD
ncbi:ABC transporter permease [Verrucomicrobia bacterium]|nr:ABC transporter permease [Verrucomicrobiota bacterium]